MIQQADSANKGKVVYPSAFLSDEETFVDSLRKGNRAAQAELFHRYADYVERLLVRVMGWDSEIPDLTQEVFVQVLSALGSFRGDYNAFKPWITRITVFTARGWIRKRRARRWLRIHAPEQIPDVPADVASPDQIQTLHRAYQVIEKLPVSERIPFTLRYIADMELTEVADACEVSLATIKRRLYKARKRFTHLAAHDPFLMDYLKPYEEVL